MEGHKLAVSFQGNHNKNVGEPGVSEEEPAASF